MQKSDRNKKTEQLLYRCTKGMKQTAQKAQKLRGYDTMTEYITMLLYADFVRLKRELKKQHRKTVLEDFLCDIQEQMTIYDLENKL